MEATLYIGPITGIDSIRRPAAHLNSLEKNFSNAEFLLECFITHLFLFKIEKSLAKHRASQARAFTQTDTAVRWILDLKTPGQKKSKHSSTQAYKNLCKIRP